MTESIRVTHVNGRVFVILYLYRYTATLQNK